jgi:pimeloyl-ACP methyl ester carboxylesterase
MLMVPGATGSADSFKRVTEHLGAHYTAVIYDRRGFSRSQLDGPQDYDHRLETDADDVRRLIEHLSDEPATVFGASSGGVVALEVLTHHLSVVRTLVPFEPAAVRQLPDGQKWVDFFFEVNAKARLLKPTSPEEGDPNIAAALAAVSGARPPPQNLSERLAAIKARQG